MNVEKALPDSGSARRFLFWLRNRHLAEWRFLLFTVTVTVYPKIWNVNVIGITSPPSGGVAEPPFFTLATPALSGMFILYNPAGFVNIKH